MTDHKPEISNLDESQLEALRGQLKAIVGGQGASTSAFSPMESTHDQHISTHSDSDGWA
jgi:hypothetical protein